MGNQVAKERGNDDVDELDGVEQAFVVVEITMDEVDAQRGELGESLGLGGVGERGPLYQSEGLVAGESAGFDDGLSDVPTCSDHQYLALCLVHDGLGEITDKFQSKKQQTPISPNCS